MSNSSSPPKSTEHSAVANVATIVARYRSQSFTILGPPPSLPEGTGLLDDPDAIWAEEEWSQERLRQAEETEVCPVVATVDTITITVGVLVMYLVSHLLLSEAVLIEHYA